MFEFIRNHSKLSMAAISIGCAGLMYLATPGLLERSGVLKPVDIAQWPDTLMSLDPVSLNAGPVFTVSDQVNLSVQSVIKTSETLRVSVEISAAILGHAEDFENLMNGDPINPLPDGVMSTDPPAPPVFQQNFQDSYAISISASPLQISPEDYLKEQKFVIGDDGRGVPSNTLTWHWTLSSEKAGNYLIILDGLPEAEGFRSWDAPDHVKWIGNGAVEIPVRVLTPAGFTAEQMDWISTLSAGAALIAAIAGFGIWKLLFGRAGQAITGGGPRRPTSSGTVILPGDPRYNVKDGKK